MILTVTSYYGKRELELTERRRAGYLVTISWEQQAGKLLNLLKHFILGWPADTWDELTETGYQQCTLDIRNRSNMPLERSERAKKEKRINNSKRMMMEQTEIVRLEKP